MMQVHTTETIHSDMRDDDVDGLRLVIHKMSQQINGLIAENAQLRLQLSIKNLRGQYAASLGSCKTAETTAVADAPRSAAR